ncbi:MAG: DUF3793 family protein [Oscillospiraceae bacterium]|nr:DUF3793 family protein [Oscillospiraceae bacterium]
MSEERIVRGAAPTLAGLKTGSLFPCRFESRGQLIGDLGSINRRLGGHGLCLLPLRLSDDGALLYLFRPAQLQRDLENAGARSILREAGYGDLRPGRCLPQLLARFRSGGAFPHEVGLFLGYPPEDVRGFMENRGRRCKCAGCWKVYGDAEDARRRFAVYHSCTDRFCRQYAAGMSLEELSAM